MHNPPLLSIQDLIVDFQVEDTQQHGKAQLRALAGVSFDMAHGETLALVGESGSGKSVASLAIMGLLPKENASIVGGEIRFQGEDLCNKSEKQRRKLRGREIAMIFQNPMTSLNPVQKVKHQIAEVLTLHKNLTEKAAQTQALQQLLEVGMTDLSRVAESYPHQLSGGQQQRVMIAMALACEPKLMIADEPTTALDVTIQKQVLELIAQLQKKHQMALLFITHDLALVRQIAQNVVVLRQGKVREYGTTEAIFNQPQDQYTRALMACRPPASGRPENLPVIEDFMDEEKDKVQTAKPIVSSTVLTANTKMTGRLLEVEKLNTWLGKDSWLGNHRRNHAVKAVSFTLNRGETLGIVGESGSGKTTLGLSLLRLYPTMGKIMMGDQDILMLSKRDFMPYRKRMQVIFQNALSSLNPRFTVGDVLTEPLRVHNIGGDRHARQAIALKWLDRVGLPKSAWNRYPHEFSGGQCQRIAIARSLTLNPEMLICDESVSALDVSIQAQILNLLRELQQSLGLSYLFICGHNLNAVLLALIIA